MNLPRLQSVLTSAARTFVSLFQGKPKPLVYVALGDSTVEGIGATRPERSYVGIISRHLESKGRELTFHNVGKAGARVIDVNELQIDTVVKASPNLITISVGANDIRLHTNPKQFRAQLRHLFARLTDETSATIIMNNIPDISLSRVVPEKFKTMCRKYVQLLNMIISQEAKRFKVTVVDLFSKSKLFMELYPESFSHDGFHPSDFGYAIWANTMLPYIEKSLLR
jgi:acyl-CoA thioesterase-1